MSGKKRKKHEVDAEDDEAQLTKDKDKPKEEEKPKFLHPKSRRAHSMMRAQMRRDDKKQIKKTKLRALQPDMKKVLFLKEKFEETENQTKNAFSHKEIADLIHQFLTTLTEQEENSEGEEDDIGVKEPTNKKPRKTTDHLREIFFNQVWDTYKNGTFQFPDISKKSVVKELRSWTVDANDVGILHKVDLAHFKAPKEKTTNTTEITATTNKE